MSRRADRREARDRARVRPDADRVALERRIAETIQEDAHTAGHHAVVPSRTCPRCPATEFGRRVGSLA